VPRAEIAHLDGAPVSVATPGRHGVRSRNAQILRAKIPPNVPIYEYECHECRRRVSLLVRSLSSPEPPACPRCGGTALSRLMSRFTTVKSEDARLESLASDGGFGDLDEGDPSSVARFMKKMGKEFGDELGEDFDSAVDEAMTEDTESPDAGGTSDEL
jgi:putative FmdB family regulatory protein